MSFSYAVNKPSSVVVMHEVCRKFDDADNIRYVLNKTNFEAPVRSLTAITGPSGSGKSTLINLLGGLDVPDSGRIKIAGNEITGINETERTIFRRKNLGIVFQFFNLIPTLTVKDNLRLPLELCQLNADDTALMSWLERFDLQDRANDYPDILSGGEQQRIAFIRAAIHRPKLVLADEPTGNLDEKQGQLVLNLIRRIADEGTCVIMVTHNRDAALYADRHFQLTHGKLTPISLA